jgi:hypothetical protein
MGHFLSITYPPAAKLTEKHLPDLRGNFSQTDFLAELPSALAILRPISVQKLADSQQVYIRSRDRARGVRLLPFPLASLVRSNASSSPAVEPVF